MLLKVQLTDIANDTFAFGAWIEGRVKGSQLAVSYQDIETINQNVLDGLGADVCKVSFSLLPHILDQYVVLPVGATLARDACPCIVSYGGFSMSEISSASIVVPGKNTTAFLLTQYLLPQFKSVDVLSYDKILESLREEKYDCGLLIHSSSSSTKGSRLQKVVNLFDLWFRSTKQQLLPLGGIVAKRSLGKKILSEITRCISESLIYAKSNKNEILKFVLEKSLHKNLELALNNLDVWVNEETYLLSKDGKKSIAKLFEMARFVANDKKPFKETLFHSL